ncbi:MAG: hypothetical protein E6Q61_09285 [Nitrosomonas sp.]|nr:MAG: hypothetical protein E6Q61_09285 [Nitrosomonas sp.]
MKKPTLSFIAFALFVVCSSAAFAEGAKVEKSTLINASQTAGSINAAIGKDSTANTGSISIKDGAEVKDSTVINASQTAGSINAAIGDGSTANTGSVSIGK